MYVIIHMKQNWQIRYIFFNTQTYNSFVKKKVKTFVFYFKRYCHSKWWCTCAPVRKTGLSKHRILILFDIRKRFTSWLSAFTDFVLWTDFVLLEFARKYPSLTDVGWWERQLPGATGSAAREGARRDRAEQVHAAPARQPSADAAFGEDGAGEAAEFWDGATQSWSAVHHRGGGRRGPGGGEAQRGQPTQPRGPRAEICNVS